ncbi:MAG TPA: hypothetical protein VK914_09720 [bacterium]|nr:hypothetical protein [bacterium]
MKKLMVVLGAFLILIGLAWIGQGTGRFPYPAGNIMNNNMAWAYRGTGLAVLGIILVVFSRKRGKK